MNAKAFFALSLALLLAVTSACGSNRATLPLVSSPNNPYRLKTLEGASWWRCKFKVAWPANSEPDAAVDLYLAHAVVGPILARHIADAPYWRFHRRAARDAAGHQFSFLFYAKPELAPHILTEIQDSVLLRKAIAAGLVENVSMHDPAQPGPTDIAEPSDPRWSASLRKNWPSYIMGVSALWLGLVDDAMARKPQEQDEARELLEEYREADQRVTHIWRSEGQHALLHHMNAIFGYGPMLIQKDMAF